MKAADTLHFGGPDFEPVDSRSWRLARKAGRESYYRKLADLLDAEHDQQTARGFDRANRKLARLLRRRTGDYEAAPGPPLSPWRELSRVRRNRRWSVTPNGCRLYWVGRVKPKLSVMRLLMAHAHRDGEIARGTPVRDVLGIAPSRVARAVAAARKWWADAHPGDRFPPAARARPPEMVGGVDISRLPAAAREQARRYPFVARYLVPSTPRRPRP